VHAIDLPRAIDALGERAYRTAHLDAGLIGQRLNMAALRLGYGASGIGGFFDEFLNALLLLPPQYAIAYVTTIGVPA
jgi:nitroreductase